MPPRMVKDTSDCSRPPVRRANITDMEMSQAQPRKTPIPTHMNTTPVADIVYPKPRGAMPEGYPTPTSPQNPNGAPSK